MIAPKAGILNRAFLGGGGTFTTYVLTTTAAHGRVNVSPFQTLSGHSILAVTEPFVEGAQVAVSPQADAGYMFVDWGGDLSGSDDPETITLDDNKTIVANFTLIV